MKFVRLFIMVLIISLLLPACSTQKGEDRYTGILADEDIVSSIKQEIADKENSLLANENDVFWSESGKLWHKSYDCSYLANSKTILHGTVEEAKLEGKEKACERCSSVNVENIYTSLENRECKPGDVFFTKEQSIFHTNINCDAIIGAQKIYWADEQTAKLLGKISACDKCK